MFIPRTSASLPLRATQRGGTLLGIIIGMLIGLFVALAVAVYVTKVPIPFSSQNKTVSGSVQAEIEKNKSWDPNAALSDGLTGLGKTVTPPEHTPEPQDPGEAIEAASTAIPKPTKPPKPAKTANDTPQPNPAAKATAAPAAAPTPTNSDDPLADLVKRKAALPQGDVSSQDMAAKAEPFVYYIQIGAFVNRTEAESQKAQAAMSGFSASISERDQAGRLVHRVRLGPFDSKEAADAAKARATAAGMSSALVRIPR
jgi:cell division protein FtsN